MLGNRPNIASHEGEVDLCGKGFELCVVDIVTLFFWCCSDSHVSSSHDRSGLKIVRQRDKVGRSTKTVLGMLAFQNFRMTCCQHGTKMENLEIEGLDSPACERRKQSEQTLRETS